MNLYERVKNSITIGDFYRYKGLEFPTSLDISGGQFRCQIHGEDKNPSAFYYAKTRSMYCHACQFGGDLIEVCKKIQGFSSAGEAMEYLLTIFADRNISPVIDMDSANTRFGNLYIYRARIELFEAFGNKIWDIADGSDDLSIILRLRDFFSEFRKCEDLNLILTEFDKRF